MPRKSSVAKRSLQLTGLFEAEVLLELMLRYWGHPLADKEEFREGLLESAAEILRVAVSGERVIEDLEPENTNLITAIVVAEITAFMNPELSETERNARQDWIEKIRRTLPSCFCDPDQLL